MGTVTARVMGNVRGKVGTVIFSKWRNLYIAKGLYSRKKRKKGTVQLPQVSRIVLMSTFLRRFKTHIKIGFYKKASKQTEWTTAITYNLANAVEGAFPNHQINHRKIKLSNGNLEGAWTAKILFEPGQIRVTWQMSELANQKLIGKDKAIIILYSLKQQIVIPSLVPPDRSALEFTYGDVADEAGDTYHSWIFFVSADGKRISNSDYVGSGTVIA